MNSTPTYIPKRAPGDAEPWIAFGSDEQHYERWIPEVCGICCLKMVGDTVGVTNKLSLYELTMMALANGTFMVDDTGRIRGVFHAPLARLAQDLGLPCQAVTGLDVVAVTQALAGGRYTIVSIDLAKVRPSMRGGHLILVYGYVEASSAFLVHDCASAIDADGRGVTVPLARLDAISNRRGLVIG